MASFSGEMRLTQSTSQMLHLEEGALGDGEIGEGAEEEVLGAQQLVDKRKENAVLVVKKVRDFKIIAY